MGKSLEYDIRISIPWSLWPLSPEPWMRSVDSIAGLLLSEYEHEAYLFQARTVSVSQRHRSIRG